jgi:hypothetical protein
MSLLLLKKYFYSTLVGKAKRKRPFGRPKSRWANIKMDLTEAG